MRPASSRVVTLWITVPCLLAALCSINPLASAEAAKGSKRTVSKQALRASVRRAAAGQTKTLTPSTTLTWTGGGGSNNNWSDAANWGGTAIASGDNLVIGLTTANTVDDQSYSIGMLTLSGAGDTVALNNNVQTTVSGNITNNGTITFNANGNTTGLYLNNSLTLSGSGTIDLTTVGSSYTGYLYGNAGSVLTTSSNIVGAGNVGNGELNFINTGTMNANISGQALLLDPDTCPTCTNTNTSGGILEATNGGTLALYNGTWTNTGGTISAGTGSAVELYNSTSITGGTLSTTGTGQIYVPGGYQASLTGLTISTGSAVNVQNNGELNTNGTITNNGTITLQANGNATLLYAPTNTTLTGTGSVVMTTVGSSYTGIIQTASGATLTNDETISGWGTIEDGTFVNNGTVNANQSGGVIVIQSLAAGTNTKTMEATNGGTLVLNGDTWTNTGGTISAATGSAVELYGSTSITGGTLSTSGTGQIYVPGGYQANLTALTISTGSALNVQNNGELNTNGTITNNGTITLQANGNGTYLYASTNTTLTGTGSVVMTSVGTSYTGQIDGVSGTSLTIDEPFSGAGNVGDGNLTLINNSTINANLSPTVTGTALTIQPSSGGVTNTGTLEATNGGTLAFDGGNITNSGGTITAVGDDGHGNASAVELYNSVSITGGTLNTSGAGQIYVPGGWQANITNLTNNGTLNVQNNGELNTNGTITNNGTIALQGNGNGTFLYAPTNTTLTGTGSVVMTSVASNYTGIIEAASGVTLTNDETISGWGTIEGGTFVNNGTVNANLSGGVIVIQSLAAGTNTATMEATNGGTLVLNGDTWTNTGATISAATGSAVELYNSTSVTGGTLSSSGTGQIYVPGGWQANLTGLTISTGSALNVQNNGQLNIGGTITNNGTITLQANGNGTYLYVPSGATLSGTGSVVMTSTASDYTGIIDIAAGQTLTNNETISGWGTIENGTLVNNGTVDANQNGGVIVFVGLNGTNTKTMEATNGGTLVFDGTTWTNTNGTITAQTGSAVELYNSASITGGTLSTAGTGQFYVPGGYVAYLSGLTNSGTFNIQNNGQLELTGTITNNGTINVTGTGNDTYLFINGPVTLSGSGTINLNGSCTSCNIIYGEGTSPSLTSSNTIEGAGFIGQGNLAFTNNGTVNANITGQNLTIDTTAGGFTNYNATTTTLTGGKYIANGGSIDYNFGNTTGITTLSASVTEENGGQFINTNNSSNALAGLTSITSTGALTIGGVAFTDAGAFSNAGSLTILAGESFNVGSLTQISSGKLTAGTYVLDANLNLTGTAQTITTNAANLTLAGGTIENTSNSTNALAGLASNTGKLTIAGTTNNVSTTAASFSNTGTLTIDAGDGFTAKKLTQISSGTLTAGTYVLAGNLDLTTTGISVTTNSANLTLEGGTIKSGSANALAALAANTAELTIAHAVTTSAASFSNTGTLTIDKNDSFTAGNLTQISSGTLSGGTYVLAGNLDLTTSGISVTTNSANLTLEGGTINSNSVNALSALASNTAELTIAGTSTAVSTTAASFSNTGTLTINKGDSFTAPALTQISGTTLTAGTYVLAGNLDLTGTASVTTNSANLTLEGGTIQTGTTNDLAGLNNNTGTFTLASNASFSTAGSFSNSGTVDIAKGSTLTVSGTGKSYSQTAGTTTIDGTLAGIAGGATVTGGTILGAGTVKGNLSVGNATGPAATINVGDTGKAGLLSITGTYTQLATGTMTGFVNGTTAGTGYSQLKVTGAAALAGTINFTVSASFQSSLTLGEKFTVLTASSVTGTFSNSTIAINSTFQFDVSYTSTGVVLTVAAATPAAGSSSGTPAAQLASTKLPVNKSTAVRASSGLRQQHVGGAVGTAMRPILARGPQSGLRNWERVPVISAPAKPVALSNLASPVNAVMPRNNIATPNLWVGQSHGAQSTLAGWTGTSVQRRVPVKIMPPSLPRIMR